MNGEKVTDVGTDVTVENSFDGRFIIIRKREEELQPCEVRIVNKTEKLYRRFFEYIDRNSNYIGDFLDISIYRQR